MNALQSPSHVNRDSYNVIPLEQRTEFSSAVGELLPVYYDLLYPGDKVTIENILKSRTMELASAAMCHVTEHLDWFAVPLSQLYHPFEYYQFGIWDAHSNFYDPQTVRNDLPRIPRNIINLMMQQLCTRDDPYFPQIKGTSMRLFEFFDIPLHKYARSDAYNFPMDIMPWVAAAYQKCYFDYFRLTDREANDPNAYNFDSFYDGTDPTSPVWTKLMTLRYRSWNKDFYTHLYTSPLMGVESLGSWNQAGVVDEDSPLYGQFKQWLSSSAEPGSGVFTADPIDTYDTANPTQVYFNSYAVDSAASIRTSFAVEKLLEITRRAGKHVDQQLLAHFGVKVSPKVAGEVEHIAHFAGDIAIGDVIATSAGSVDSSTGRARNAFGQVGGKGYGSANGRFKWRNDYTCPVILLCVYSANPDVDYAVTGLGRFNTYLNNSDFFKLPFNNLGMQPQFAYQRFLYLQGQSEKNAQVVGWQWRWMESKCKPNRTVGALARSLYFWTTRRSLVDENVGLSSFLVNPKFLDPIMQKSYDFGVDFDWETDTVEPTEFTDTPSSLFDSDPLIHEFYCHCNKSTKMSTFGLPSL